MKQHLVGILLAATVVWIGCSGEKRRDVPLTEADTAIEVGRNVEILYSDSARVRVRILAPILHNVLERENPRQEFPNGIQVDFIDPNLNVMSTLTAKIAVREMDKGIVTARDSVVLSTVKQERLETEELIWDERSGKVRTDKFVKITKPGEVLYGFGLEASQDFSYWKIIVPKGRIAADPVNKVVQ